MKKISFSFFLTLLSFIAYAQTSLIDVRTSAEFDQAHADGAINIPVNSIEASIDNFVNDKDADIYLYCRSGKRANIAQNILIKMGYTHVTNLGTLQNAKNFVTKNANAKQ